MRRLLGEGYVGKVLHFSEYSYTLTSFSQRRKMVAIARKYGVVSLGYCPGAADNAPCAEAVFMRHGWTRAYVT